MTLWSRLAGLAEAGEPFVLATVTWRRAPSSGRTGAKAIIRLDGSMEGWIGGACAEPTVIREALSALTDGHPRLLVLGEHDQRHEVTNVPMSCESEGAMEVYLEPQLPAPHLVVVGRSPLAHTLAHLAQGIGWRVIVREDAYLEGIGPRSFVVVATQGHHDEPVLEQALASPAAYIGLVASEKRAASVREYLRSRGVPDSDLARIEAPAGLDLGSLEQEEMAVAILAGMVARRAANRAGVEVEMPEQAIDPVCEMIVDPETAKFSSEYQGRTYYFCASGCKLAFDRSPEVFVGGD